MLKAESLEYLKQPDVGPRMLEIFFEAMRAGYASSPQKGTIAELPGSKTIEFVREGWRVLDMYLVTPQSSASGGMTTIWYDDIPVWTMQYMGEYEPCAISCLKAALRANYEKSIFLGGRGPVIFRHGDGDEEYNYFNMVEGNDLAFFSGYETVWDVHRRQVGWHRYQGMCMVK